MGEWISVKDMLPDECVNVLVYDESGDVYKASWSNERCICWTDYSNNEREERITHWQPLPLPPKGAA